MPSKIYDALVTSGMKAPRFRLGPGPQILFDTSHEYFIGAERWLGGRLSGIKVPIWVLELLGQEAYVEKNVEFAVLVDMTNIANPKALLIGFIFWSRITQRVTKALSTE